jgi:dUTP pyrophosphatase
MSSYILKICIHDNDPQLHERYTSVIQRHNHTMQQYYSALSNLRIDSQSGVDTTFQSTMNDILNVDSGFDLFVPASQEFSITDTTEGVGEGLQYKLDHNVSCAMYRKEPSGLLVPVGYYMYPRSSISKTPLSLANSVGIIDSGYRGHLIAKFNIRHFGNGVGTGGGGGSSGGTDDVNEFSVEPYSRLCQICTPDLSPLSHIQIVDSLTSTTRGDGGFGSTG